MQCPACGVDVVPSAIFCHKCGQRLESEGNGAPQDLSVEVAATPAGAFQQVAASRWESKAPPEEELWKGGYSPKAMLGGWVSSGCVSIALLLIGIIWVRDGFWWMILVAGMILPWLYFLSVLGYRRISVHYSLSNQRFIHEKGFFRRVNDRIELLDIDDITFEQKLWERLMGVGTLRLASHDRSNPELILPGIEDIKKVASLFDNARLDERRRRGLHVEQV
jgi:hypothetical protein